MITVVRGDQLDRAFAIALWRETGDALVSFDDCLLSVQQSRAGCEAEWMDVDDFAALFGYDMLAHVRSDAALSP